MSYWKSKGDCLYFAESTEGDQTARWLGLTPVSAPALPKGTWLDIGSGLARLDTPKPETKSC